MANINRLALTLLFMVATTGCPGDGGANSCLSGACDAGPGVVDGARDQRGERITSDSGDMNPGPDTFIKPPGFKKGYIYVAGSRNAEVFEFDPTFKLLNRWTHPSFGKILPAPGQSLTLGPAGMSFDAKGNLVVAAYASFCVFSRPNVLVACHPKIKAQATENVIFDHLGNIYSTTSTGGTNEVHKYNVSYKHLTTFSIKTGELTGITCDPTGNLYIASQDKGKGHIYKVDRKTFAVLDTIDVNLTGVGSLEGLQYLKGGRLLVATFGGSKGVLHINATSPFTLLGTIRPAGLYGAVPVTIDGVGNIYTADYEDGSGTARADLWSFTPAGKIIASSIASPIYGPFGMVVAGTVLPCGAFRIK